MGFVQHVVNTKRAGLRYSHLAKPPARLVPSNLRLFNAVALHELINTTLGVEHGLLSRKVGMASRACVDAHLFFGRTRSDHIAAGTGNRCVFVFGVCILLHKISLSVIRNEKNS